LTIDEGLQMASQILSTSIFLVTFGLILSGKLNRVIAALTGAVLMLVVGAIFGFYTEEQAMAAIDLRTIALLFGMMILVAMLEPTGWFESLAIWAARLSKGKPVRLLVLLGVITSVASMFLDNVTTIVLIAPITIMITELLGLRSYPFLISEALLSNTGGVATLIGDPPNVLIASAANLTFNDFLSRAFPVVIVVWVIALLLLRWLFRTELSEFPKAMATFEQLSPNVSLREPETVFRLQFVMGIALILFLGQDQLGISPAVVAIAAATSALIWVRPDLRETLGRIEWEVLLFFAALFVVIGGMESAGVFQWVADMIINVQHLPPALLGVILLWVVALLSAVVDNIPITIAMIPVIQDLGMDGVNIEPLWWALAFGAGFGGNGTIIGSTANIVVTSLSNHTQHPITASLWNKKGLPVMLVTCTVASILFLLVYPLFAR
jgi:Na+/H+ antiporter NhaD/arsenite permease-like protein